MKDEDGNELYFAEEMRLLVNDDEYALLVPTVSDEEAAEHAHGDEECECDDDDAAFFAKIVKDENGEEEYIEPNDEEFKAVCAAYDELVDDEDSQE